MPGSAAISLCPGGSRGAPHSRPQCEELRVGAPHPRPRHGVREGAERSCELPPRDRGSSSPQRRGEGLHPPPRAPLGAAPWDEKTEHQPLAGKQGPSGGDREARRAGQRRGAPGRPPGGRRCPGSGGGRRCFPRRAEEEISGFLMRGCRRAERWDYTARRQSCGLCVRAGLVVSARLPANRTFSAVKKKRRRCGRAQCCLCDCDMKRWRSLPSPSLSLSLHFLPNSFCLPVF